MDWAGWALFGLVATAALTAVMIMSQLAGLTRLDLPLLLGTIVTQDPDRARVAGFFLRSRRGGGVDLCLRGKDTVEVEQAGVQPIVGGRTARLSPGSGQQAPQPR